MPKVALVWCYDHQLNEHSSELVAAQIEQWEEVTPDELQRLQNSLYRMPQPRSHWPYRPRLIVLNEEPILRERLRYLLEEEERRIAKNALVAQRDVQKLAKKKAERDKKRYEALKAQFEDGGT